MEPIAIIGMAAHFGPCASLDSLARSLYAGDQHFQPLPPTRQPLAAAEPDPAGAYIDPASLVDRQHIPGPTDLSQLVPLLLLRVVQQALSDAAPPPGSRLALLLAADTPASDLGHTIARELANEWNIRQPVPVIAAGSSSTFHALEAARPLLESGSADLVVLAAVDIGGSLRKARTTPDLNHGTPTLSYGANAAGWLVGEGAGAVVLARPDQAHSAGQRTYATILGSSLVQHDSPLDADAIARTIAQAHANAGIHSTQVGYLEVSGSGLPAEDEAEQAALLRAYPAAAAAADDECPLTCALGSIRATIGHTGAAAGMASLIKTALCLFQRYIPATPAWTGPHNPDQWQPSPFYVAPDSRPWFLKNLSTPRIAALSSVSQPGTCAHVVLAEDPQQPRSSRYLVDMPLSLFPIVGNDSADLLAQIEALAASIEAGTTLKAAAHQCFTTWQQREAAPYALALVAATREELAREIERARTGIPAALSADGKESEWKTPNGSYFTARPLGERGKVAFVYPGAFNAYVGLGQNLFQLFPSLHERFRCLTANASRLIGEHLLYPRSMARLSAEELKAHEAHMLRLSVSMLEVGTSFAVLYTILMRDIFGIQPAIAFGYSQGETAMLHALRVWQDGDANSDTLRSSPLYYSRLSGPKHAVRDFWELGPDDPPDNELWANYILMVSADKVLPVLEQEPHVYLAIITAPREVMISGDPAGCQRVIKQVKGRSLRAPFTQVIHSPPIASEYAQFVRINSLPVHAVPGVTFYSAAEYAPLALDEQQIARSIAHVFCNQLDFTRLTERVYEDDARIFIELGAARNCSRWIDATLGEREHTALSINKKGLDDHTSLVRVLAQLLSHRVRLNLAPLYEVGADNLPASVPTPAYQPALATADHSEAATLYGYYQEALQHSTRQEARSHAAFLQARQQALHQMDSLIQQYVDVAGQHVPPPPPVSYQPDPAPEPPPPPPPPPRSLVLNDEQVREFTIGSVVACLGERYRIYDGRRVSRTPNGALQMMHRITGFQGDPERSKLEPGTSLVSEYDVPPDAWYFQQNAYPTLPYFLLMEIALQPCGFLSAYLHSALLLPDEDLYFRNLDGTGQTGDLPSLPDLRGKTITNEAVLLSSTFIRGVIIQKFRYSVAYADQVFYAGESVFGFFTPPALANQVGLDAGKAVAPWYQQQASLPAGITLDMRTPAAEHYFTAPAGKPHYRLSREKLNLLHEVLLIPGSGKQQQGYVYARMTIDPQGWFFDCHFHEDPVMPGSLGVEAIIQAMQLYALQQDLGRQFVSPHFGLVPNHRVDWKYRGQIVASVPYWALEVHITSVTNSPEAVIIQGEASVWREQLRIYEVSQIALCISETSHSQPA